MPCLKDYGYSASGTSLNFNVTEHIDEVACKVEVKFTFGAQQLSFDLSVLCDDVRSFTSLLSDHWEYILQHSPWDSTEPAFSITIAEIKAEIAKEYDQPLYRIYFWVDSGEINKSRSTRTGVGISIVQQKDSIYNFAKAINKQFEERYSS
ncbi:hypothetical protein ERY13_08235 [Paenibacillus mucilaginosus]|uniref:hypothetical protein n=1 Tax=Paenibacillus mucilaginosus TaxID=61624 RepID=UPI0011D1A8C5|nr:hypothetical protein [Paenibacillus mucilaginosus]WFA17278.1 hypothetical protein ERY13_08235 [Paenibacillus mucilaginosus]